MTAQLALFADEARPSGLRYQREFISAGEERALLDRIRALPLAPFQFGPYEGKRRVVSFGLHYDFAHQRLEEAAPLPSWILPLAAKVEALAVLPAGAVRHVLLTEYEPGAAIGWHRDKADFDLVFGVSLASACRLRFRRKRGSAWERFALIAEPRSLYVMSGEVRSAWQHSIPPVESIRYSITLRTLAARQ